MGRKTVNIEKRITQIWVGPEPSPLEWMDTWKLHHLDWEYEVFTDQMVRDRQWTNQDLVEYYYNQKDYQRVSDIVRYELLLERGGFIPQSKMQCFENTEELFVSPAHFAYTCYENETHRPNIVHPIMACNPGNLFVRMIVETFSQIKSFESANEELVSQLVANNLNKIKIWPSHHFIPHYLHHSPYDGEDKVYATYHWV